MVMDTSFKELAGQRTDAPLSLGGSDRDCPSQQKNGARESIESCPGEDRYKAILPFMLLGKGKRKEEE